MLEVIKKDLVKNTYIWRARMKTLLKVDETKEMYQNINMKQNSAYPNSKTTRKSCISIYL